jgi:NAD(P)-dependent dehydrogenase (short-subunit alcohol dehydrogenase family)/acyl carrier protein
MSDTEVLLAALGHLHCLDVAIDWPTVHGGALRRKVTLPTYPFERQRYWADWGASAAAVATATAPAAFGKLADPDKWLYRPGWKTAPPATITAAPHGRWLVFMDGEGLGRALLPPGLSVVEVTAGDGYARLGPDRYVIDPTAAADYQRLIQELETPVEHIVHLWALPARDDAAALCLGLLGLAQALGPQAGGVTLDIVTTGLFDVTGEEVLQPEKAVLMGPARVISQEYPAIRCRVVDISLPVTGPMAELGGDAVPPVLACRGRSRWVPVYDPAAVPSATAAPSRLRAGGCYLITGGLGNIGLTLAEAMARAGAGQLLLTSRSGLPPAAEWDGWLGSHDANDGVSRKIRRVRAVEALGARVLVLGADAADLEQMRAVVQEAQRRAGRLDGVIHCAGIVAPGDLLRAVQDTGAPQLAVHFRPKVDGLKVLDQVLPRDLDFCLLCSSLSTVLGGVGFAAYAAANHFLDAFATWKNRTSSFPWLSIGWDGWLAEGDAGDGFATRFALTAKDGAQAFERLLRLPPDSRIVVSTTDLAARLALGQALESGEALSAAKAGAGKAGAAKQHDRPDLQTEYVAPRTALEQGVAEAWQAVLGFERIGVNDNFFSLGGDSLAAIQLCSRLRAAFQVELTVHTLFDEPTIAALAVRVERLQQDNAAASEDLLRQIEMLESMSEEEVAKLLATMEAE